MSMNFALVFLPNTPLESIVTPVSFAALSFEDASSSTAGGPTAAAFGEHTVLLDPTLSLLDSPIVENTPGAALIGMSDTSSTYVFQVFGLSPRLRVEVEGEIVEDEGEPLAVEVALDSAEFPDDGHFAVFQAVSGLDFTALDALQWFPLKAASTPRTSRFAIALGRFAKLFTR